MKRVDPATLHGSFRTPNPNHPQTQTSIIMKSPNDILNFTRSNIGISGYECKSCDPKYNAQRNLDGRTHYADDDTLRFFSARILSAREEAEGLLFVLIESVPNLSKACTKTKRAVVFDIFGTVVNDRDGEAAWHKTSDKAKDAARDFVAGFDVIAHTLKELECKAKRKEDEAAAIRQFLV